MNKKNSVNFAIGILSLLFVGLACSVFTEGKAAGEKGVAAFHSQMNTGKFDEIYNNATKEFQASDRKETIINFLKLVREKLGTVKNSSSQSWNVNKNTAGSFVTLVYQTEFEQDSAVTETFIFVLEGENAKLHNYKVNSKRLMD